jgi:chromosome segregation ATPase
MDRTLSETKDRTTRIESDVTSWQAAMADGSAKLEEVRREVAGQKAQLSDCCPKLKKDSADLQRKLAKLNVGVPRERETYGANPSYAAENATDLGADSDFE